MFVDLFIRRPILSTVLSLVIILAGAAAIPTLPIAQYPELAPPQVSVTAIYTGANAQAVESAVTIPIEQAINGAEGMLYMTSTSTSSGVSTVTATFSVDRNQDLAAVDVQNRVSTAQGRLPNEVKNIGVTVTKASAGFIMAAGVYAEGGQYDSLFMSNYLDVFVRDALKRVPGVADVLIFGERKYAMRLWLDPTRLASRGLTAADVTGALREQNVQVAAGAVGQPPVPSGQLYQISVRAAGRLSEPTEFENIIVKAGTDGTLIRLKDIGRAELGAETYSSALRFNGVEAVGFGVMQLPSANALDVYNDCVAELERLAKAFPPGMKYQIAFDTATVVQDSIREVVITLFEAIGLVVIVMFLFLQDWRSTIIPAATIPVSLVGVFAFVKLLGFSINTLTLFGIVLATGIVVDDAIVVIENIQRHISEYGRTARQAASEAMGEVLGAVIATALVLIAVFVPVAFFPGTTGRLYQQFSLTIAFSVALSAFNAVTLTPALSALLLKKEGKKGAFFRLVEAIIDRGHARLCRGGASRRPPARRDGAPLPPHAGRDGLGVSHGAERVPARRGPGLFHHPDSGAGRRLARVHEQHRQADRAGAAPEKDIASAFTVGGFSFSGASPNRGLLFVRLKPYDERRNDEQSAQAIVTRLRGPAHGRHQRGDCLAVPAAADSRPRRVRRVPVRGARPDRRADRKPRRGDAEPRAAGEPYDGAARTVHLVHDRRPAAVRRYRSAARQVAEHAAQRSDRRAASVPRLAIRQRLRLQQPRVSRVCPGRPAVPERSDVPGAVLRARRHRGDGAALEPRAREGNDGAAGHQPLQPVPLRRDQRRGGAGIQLGPGPRGDGRPGVTDAAGRHDLRVGGPVAWRRSTPARRRG